MGSEMCIRDRFGHDGTRFVEAPADARSMAEACSAPVQGVLLLDKSYPTELDLPQSVLNAARGRFKRYSGAGWLSDTKEARTQCFLPRKAQYLTLSKNLA